MGKEITAFAGKVRKGFPPIKKASKTNQKPRLKKLRIKLLLTDLYGTVFVANQLPKTRQYQKMLLKGFRETSERFSLGKPALELKEMFLQEIQKEHAKKRKLGAKSPEVRSEKIWEIILKRLLPEKNKEKLELLSAKVAYLSAWIFEPTGIYSSFLETALELKKRGIFLGIASNAQFYSKINLDLGLQEASSGKIRKWQQLFCPKFSAFSFEVGESKPSKKMFEKILRNAKKKGIKKSEIAFLGNDLFKDMAVGKKQGFKTILFAGDSKSLQLWKGDARVKGVKPDAVITDWKQLLKVVA